MQSKLGERFIYTLSRVFALWVDSFIIASIMMLAKLLTNLTAGDVLNGRYGEYYDVIAIPVSVWVWKSAFEAINGTTPGKWIVNLSVTSKLPRTWSALLRNSWVLLTILAITGSENVETIVLISLGLCLLFFGKHPFDYLSRSAVLLRKKDDGFFHNPWKDPTPDFK